MRSRTARLGVLLAMAAGLVASSTAPAGAVSAGAIVVVGEANVGNGVAYTCLEGKTTPPTINTAKCFPPPKVTPPPNSPNSAAFTYNLTGVGAVVNGPTKGAKASTVEAGTFIISGGGVVKGSCDLSQANGVTFAVTPDVSVGTKAKPRYGTLTFTGVGGLLVLRGATTKGESVTGVLLFQPTSGSCLNKSPKSFTIIGSIAILNTSVGPLPPPPPGGPAGPSTECTTIIHDGITAGVRTWLRVHQAAGSTALCVRVEAAGLGYGGKLVVTVPPGGPTTSGTPTLDALADQCTAEPAPVGGLHPVAAGQIGGQGDPVYVPYLIDYHATTDAAWVCLRAGPFVQRVVVPLGVPGVGGLPGVAFIADQGTPDPI